MIQWIKRIIIKSPQSPFATPSVGIKRSGGQEGFYERFFKTFKCYKKLILVTLVHLRVSSLTFSSFPQVPIAVHEP